MEYLSIPEMHRLTKTLPDFPVSDKDWPDEWKESVVKRYLGASEITLPEPRLQQFTTSLASALQSRISKRSFGDSNVSGLASLSDLLFFSVGEREEYIAGQQKKKQRMYPSAGGFFPTEVYVINLNACSELPEGLYHYRHDIHALECLAQHKIPAELMHAIGPEWVQEASLVICLTSRLSHICSKYQHRGYRYAVLEAGCVVQNLSLVGSALELSMVVSGASDDVALEEFIDIDGIHEVLLATVIVG